MDEPYKFWSDENRWPRDTSQNTFLCRAVKLVGRAVYPESWTDKEASIKPSLKLPRFAYLLREGDRYSVYTRLRFARPDLKLPELTGRHFFPKPDFTDEQWRAAINIYEEDYNKTDPHVRRFYSAKFKLFEALANGQVVSCLRAKPGGDFSSPCPVSWWNTERWDNRFFCGQMDPKNPFTNAVGGESFQWVFVETASLKVFLDQLEVEVEPSSNRSTIPTEVGSKTMSKLSRAPSETPKKANPAFIPKGHITLLEAMAQTGPLLLKDWNGDELDPVIWNVGNYTGFFSEREIFLADLVADACLKAFGEQWLTAAENYFSSLEPADLHVKYLMLKPEIEVLEKEFGNSRQAHVTITLREAARSILRHARIETGNPMLRLSNTNEPPRPSLQTATGPDPIELGEAELASFEKTATAYFEERNARRMAAQKRWQELVNWFRQELFTEILVASYIAEDGKQIPVPGHTFAQAQAEWMFRESQHEHLLFLINALALEKHISPQSNPQVISKANDEHACRKWLELQMRASPGIKLLTRKAAKESWKTQGKISARAFNRAWDAAILSSGAIAWSKAGAPKKSES
jgi:hypothetical protein